MKRIRADTLLAEKGTDTASHSETPYRAQTPSGDLDQTNCSGPHKGRYSIVPNGNRYSALEISTVRRARRCVANELAELRKILEPHSDPDARDLLDKNAPRDCERARSCRPAILLLRLRTAGSNADETEKSCEDASPLLSGRNRSHFGFFSSLVQKVM